MKGVVYNHKWILAVGWLSMGGWKKVATHPIQLLNVTWKEKLLRNKEDAANLRWSGTFSHSIVQERCYASRAKLWRFRGSPLRKLNHWDKPMLREGSTHIVYSPAFCRRKQSSIITSFMNHNTLMQTQARTYSSCLFHACQHWWAFVEGQV